MKARLYKLLRQSFADKMFQTLHTSHSLTPSPTHLHVHVRTCTSHPLTSIPHSPHHNPHIHTTPLYHTLCTYMYMYMYLYPSPHHPFLYLRNPPHIPHLISQPSTSITNPSPLHLHTHTFTSSHTIPRHSTPHTHLCSPQFPLHALCQERGYLFHNTHSFVKNFII